MIGKVSGSSGNTPIQPIKKLEKDVVPVKAEVREGASSTSDIVEISKDAQDLEKTIANLKTELNKIPDVRHEKVDAARSKIQKGFYDTKEVIKETAEILLKEFKASSGDMR
ncbi:MAG TPA: flagellar biosynthesis anti-sigma factor FlgM [Candidatus Brocadiia bacterium]|nr:flagellar biosynthesis anti-sigma factor FlgM [Planctomycetota bacterium]MDO8092797.1 flagellar biosynthesis anti-sigma factor FlgM [Candidatus Brocadiales bacterium]